MEILKAFKFRIYPTEDQRKELAIQFGHARFVYNAALELRKDIFFGTGESLNYNDCAGILTEAKDNPDLAWLKQANAQVLQQSLKDLDKAFQNFFRNKANGTLPPPRKIPRKDGMPNGYPTLRRKTDKQSIRFPQDCKLQGQRVYLPKVGWIKIRLHQQIEGQLRSITVSKTKTGKFFASILCEFDKPEPVQKDGVVGIDLGLKDFVTLATDEGTIKVEAPKFLRKSERALKIRQRRLSRKLEAKKHRHSWHDKDKGDRTIDKARLIVAATHEKITNRRKDFHHQLSRQIINGFGVIGLETLNVKGMVKNHNLAKSIADAGWAQFVSFVEYKAKWAGAEIVKHDRWFASSKTCHDCGYVNRGLQLSDRVWTCPGCGVIHDRDENAAKNLIPFG